MSEVSPGVQEQELIPRVAKSFKTAMGSVYTYDEDGKTTRFKTATGELHKRQDITVFVDLNLDEEQEILRAYLHKGKRDAKVYVLESNGPDKPAKIVRDINDVQDPNQVALGVVENGKWTLIKKASTQPVIGWNTFDHRHYKEGDEWFSDRHLGNKVTEVEY